MSAKPRKTLTSNTTSAYSLRRKNWELRNDSSNVSGLLSRGYEEDAQKRILCSQRTTGRRSKKILTHNCEECYCKIPPSKPVLNIKPPKLERGEKTPKKFRVKYGNRNCCRILHGESNEETSEEHEHDHTEFSDGSYEPFHKQPYEGFPKLGKRRCFSGSNFLENYASFGNETEETAKEETFGDCYLCEKCTRNINSHGMFNKRSQKKFDQFTTSRESGNSSICKFEEFKNSRPEYGDCEKRPQIYRRRQNYNHKRYVDEDFCGESFEDSSNEELHQNSEECDNANKNCCGDAHDSLCDNDKRVANVKNIREEFFFETHSTVNLEETPPHRCVHEFVLNDRLLPEPINADIYGTSRCAICNKPMQTHKTTPPRDNLKKSKPKTKEIPPKFKDVTFAPHRINIGANDEIVNIKIPLNTAIANITEAKTPKRPPFSNSLALRFQKLDKH